MTNLKYFVGAVIAASSVISTHAWAIEPCSQYAQGSEEKARCLSAQVIESSLLGDDGAELQDRARAAETNTQPVAEERRGSGVGSAQAQQLMRGSDLGPLGAVTQGAGVATIPSAPSGELPRAVPAPASARSGSGRNRRQSMSAEEMARGGVSGVADLAARPASLYNACQMIQAPSGVSRENMRYARALVRRRIGTSRPARQHSYCGIVLENGQDAVHHMSAEGVRRAQNIRPAPGLRVRDRAPTQPSTASSPLEFEVAPVAEGDGPRGHAPVARTSEIIVSEAVPQSIISDCQAYQSNPDNQSVIRRINRSYSIHSSARGHLGDYCRTVQQNTTAIESACSAVLRSRASPKSSSREILGESEYAGLAATMNYNSDRNLMIWRAQQFCRESGFRVDAQIPAYEINHERTPANGMRYK